MNTSMKVLSLLWAIIISLESFFTYGNIHQIGALTEPKGSVDSHANKSGGNFIISPILNFRNMKSTTSVKISRLFSENDILNAKEKNNYHNKNANKDNKPPKGVKLNTLTPVGTPTNNPISMVKFPTTTAPEITHKHTLLPYLNPSTATPTFAPNTKSNIGNVDMDALFPKATVRPTSKDILKSSTWLENLSLGSVEVKLSFMLRQRDILKGRLDHKADSKRDRNIHDEAKEWILNLTGKDVTNIDAESILAGNHPELVTTVLQSILTVICNSSVFHIVTTVPTTSLEKETTTNSGELFDYCSKKRFDITTLPYLSHAVLFADIKIPRMHFYSSPTTTMTTVTITNNDGTILDGRLSVFDRIEYDFGSNVDDDNSARTVTELMRWQEWTLYYPILQYGTYPLMGNTGMINEAHLERYINNILFNNIQNGTLDTLLIKGDKIIIASSSIGMERDTFQKVLEEISLNIATVREETRKKNTKNLEVMPTMRLLGIILMGCTLLGSTLLFTMAKRRNRRKEWEKASMQRVKGGLVTTEGVDMMLDIGRSAAVEIKENNSNGNVSEWKNRYTRTSTTLPEASDGNSVSVGPVLVQSCQTYNKTLRQPDTLRNSRASHGNRNKKGTAFNLV